MKKKIGDLIMGDKGIWTVFLFLCLISVIEVFSASSTLTYKSQNYMSPMIYHVGTLFVGVIVTVITVRIPCRYFKLITPLMLPCYGYGYGVKVLMAPTVSSSYQDSPSSPRR